MSRDQQLSRAARDLIRADIRATQSRCNLRWWQGWFDADELPWLILAVAYAAFFACVVFA